MNDPSQFNILRILFYSTLVPMVVAGIIGGLRFRYLPSNLRLLTGLLWFVIPMNFWGLYLALYTGNNLFLMPVYSAVELLLLALVYNLTLQSSSFAKAMPWLVGGYVAYVLFDSLSTPTLKVYRPGQQVIQGLLVLSFVGLYFSKLMDELRIQRLKQEPMFWVSAGLFLYFTGYLLIALFSNVLLQYSLSLSRSIWAVHSVLFIVLYVCYCAALWLSPKK